MKKLILFLSMLTGLSMFVSCGSKTSGSVPAAPAAPAAPAVPALTADGRVILTDDNFFMLSDEKLPPSLDMTVDYSQLSYSNLRLLRAFVFALHGHWFMEEDLNRFFNSKQMDCTDADYWYYSLCCRAWNYWSDSIPESRKKEVEKYYKLLETDYHGAQQMIALSEEEKAFVNGIEARMAELRSARKLTNLDGEEILNADLVCNMHQVYQPSAELKSALRTNNMAFEPTKFEQLFNIYENNEYLSMPHFVTTDVLLQAFHMLFSYELKVLEAGDMRQLLTEVFAELDEACCERLPVSEELQLEADREALAYCDVALHLLGADSIADALGNRQFLGRLQPVVDRELQLVMACEDALSPLFHTEINFNYSLFKPRGHYTRKDASKQYFRAMMWMQKGCFFREDKMQLAQAMTLAEMLNVCPSARKKLERLDEMVSYLMGEPDNVSIMEIARFMRDNNIHRDVVFEDAQIAVVDAWLKEQFKTRNRVGEVIRDAGYMQDQINLMPQRYTMDGELLGRLPDPTPNAEKAYPSGVEVMDSLLVALESDKDLGWGRTFYNQWIYSLMMLQHKDKGVLSAKGSQPFIRTDAWQKKNLNTSLASWALLKHDAILYAEQPLIGECGDGEEFPTPPHHNYVEPNVPFWTVMLNMLDSNKEKLRTIASGDDLANLTEKVDRLRSWVDVCLQCSRMELEGTSFSQNQNIWWNLQNIGSGLEWFTLSVLDPDNPYPDWQGLSGPDRFVAQVADVFTRNVIGCQKNGILYEATGYPNAIYVIVEHNGEYYLTRGATYSYYEFVRPIGDRLSDEQWQQMIFEGRAPAVPEWFAPLLIGEPVDADQRFVFSSGC